MTGIGAVTPLGNTAAETWQNMLDGVSGAAPITHFDASKFKAQFHTKPSMVPRDQVEELIGFAPGGVCPFGVREDIPVWLDVSMKRFSVIHPSAGNEFTSV